VASDVSIRDGLAVRLATITGLTAYDHIPGQINAPAATISRRVTRFDSVMARGSDDFEYVVRVYVANADPKLAQEQMSEYLAGSGAKSVYAAIDDDGTLGGVADFARVREAGEEGITPVGEVDYLAVDFVVEVCA
jgi:ABC-type sugar transport system substrate-binding protein